MKIIWDDIKNQTLRKTRGVTFSELAEMIYEGRYLDIINNPTRDNQRYFVLRFRGYTWSVPFLVDNENRIVLKTAFPNRRLHKRYRGME